VHDAAFTNVIYAQHIGPRWQRIMSKLTNGVFTGSAH